LRVDGLHVVGEDDLKIRKVAVACGAAGQFIDQARRVGCQALVTGETNFHTCLEAEATDTGLILPGHYASERFALEYLAEVLQAEFADLTVWASRDEADPLRWI
jgi:putative NIF3 family GTP cyclohydrolase 1 type 2